MSIWSKIAKAVIAHGRAINEEVDARTSTYHSNSDGHWVNKGTRYDENWVWVEKVTNLRMMYVNVLQGEDGYVLSVEFTRNKNAIESCECEDMEMVQDAIDLYEVYYKFSGKVTVDMKVME